MLKVWKIALMATPLTVGMLAFGFPVAQAASGSTSGTSSQVGPSTANAQDLGPTDTTQTMTLSLYFKVQNADQLKTYIKETTTPGSPQYHQFLSVNQFVSQYAPSNGAINQVEGYLQSYGITVTKVFSDNLVMQATGTVAQFNNAFNTTMHDYSRNGKKFRAPKNPPKVPDTLTNVVLALAGFNTASAAQPMSTTAAQATGQSQTASATYPAALAGTRMYYTVQNTANMYDINPLYQQGVTGQGETIGIATLANFVPQDAYTYWNAIGLQYKPDRITQVHVDGGGQLGSAAGSGETTLDVEQSGGLAPNANIIVYDAPNTDAGFLDVFYQAVSDNKVDSLSVSWGQPEIDYVSGMNQGSDYTDELSAFDQAFMEGAAQGISIFAASGDSGAYDTQRAFPKEYGFSTPLTVDAPASDPYITAAGGTTLPFKAKFRLGHVNIMTERPWAWDYLQNLGYSGVFSVGDGGGVSTIWSRPWYQQGVPGMQNTASGQAFTDSQGLLYGTPFTYNLPAGFAGRNVADLSMDADPETGYLVYSSTEGGWIHGYGGTSFVAPQLNGITALINQDTGSRQGLLNPVLYQLQQSQGYGSDKPFNDLADGSTNWYYHAVQGYDPAAGIGTPNVANLAAAIKSLG